MLGGVFLFYIVPLEKIEIAKVRSGGLEDIAGLLFSGAQGYQEDNLESETELRNI